MRKNGNHRDTAPVLCTSRIQCTETQKETNIDKQESFLSLITVGKWGYINEKSKSIG